MKEREHVACPWHRLLTASGVVAFSALVGRASSGEASGTSSAAEWAGEPSALATAASAWQPAECDAIYRIYAHAPEDEEA